MTFNPLPAIGLVVTDVGASEVFRGTCFLFRSPSYAVTAAHVLTGFSAEAITVRLPHTLPLESHAVQAVLSCPGADLALMMLDHASSAEPFANHVSNFMLGEDLMAYGYPEDVLGPNQGVPTPRLFRGHYQRYMYHRSHLGYAYNAGEMSIAAPAGLSGGPVFRSGFHPTVTGVVTENLASTTTLEAVEQQLSPLHTRRTEYQRVVEYGVSLLLDSWEPWLAEHLPPESSAS